MTNNTEKALRTVIFTDRIIKLNATVEASASVVGKKEHDGPLGRLFDSSCDDDKFGMKTWETAEGEMQRQALTLALKKGRLTIDRIGALFAGDLLNQCVGSAYGLLDFDVPYFGLYGACSTAVEGLILAGINVTHGIYEKCAVVTSSHNCSAERQYRLPIEYGGQRPPTAQWTVTGAGAYILSNEISGRPRIVSGMPGISIEMGIKDAGNMGAAMAPAAASTLLRWLCARGISLSANDKIVTGDLGYEGGMIFCEILHQNGIDITNIYEDCGRLIYDREKQDTHSGGSGCGCIASVLSAYWLDCLTSGNCKRLIMIGTGAMMSPDSLKQGECIPAIGHLVEIVGNNIGD